MRKILDELISSKLADYISQKKSTNRTDGHKLINTKVESAKILNLDDAKHFLAEINKIIISPTYKEKYLEHTASFAKLDLAIAVNEVISSLAKKYNDNLSVDEYKRFLDSLISIAEVALEYDLGYRESLRSRKNSGLSATLKKFKNECIMLRNGVERTHDIKYGLEPPAIKLYQAKVDQAWLDANAKQYEYYNDTKKAFINFATRVVPKVALVTAAVPIMILGAISPLPHILTAEADRYGLSEKDRAIFIPLVKWIASREENNPKLLKIKKLALGKALSTQSAIPSECVYVIPDKDGKYSPDFDQLQQANAVDSIFKPVTIYIAEALHQDVVVRDGIAEKTENAKGKVKGKTLIFTNLDEAKAFTQIVDAAKKYDPVCGWADSLSDEERLAINIKYYKDTLQIESNLGVNSHLQSQPRNASPLVAESKQETILNKEDIIYRRAAEKVAANSSMPLAETLVEEKHASVNFEEKKSSSVETKPTLKQLLEKYLAELPAATQNAECKKRRENLHRLLVKTIEAQKAGDVYRLKEKTDKIPEYVEKLKVAMINSKKASESEINDLDALAKASASWQVQINKVVDLVPKNYFELVKTKTSQGYNTTRVQNKNLQGFFQNKLKQSPRLSETLKIDVMTTIEELNKTKSVSGQQMLKYFNLASKINKETNGDKIIPEPEMTGRKSKA